MASTPKTFTVQLQPWAAKRYREWYNRYLKKMRKFCPEWKETFEEYLSGVLKNALDHMNDL